MIQNRINLNKLYYFYVVATEGSVKVASQLLNLTQPTISGQIRQLEEEIGFDLFVRKHRKLEISQRGRRVLKIAEEIFKLANDLSDKTLLSGSQERLAVNIGAVQSLSNTFINNFSTKIWRDETIQVNITQGRLDALRKMLDTNKIDILLADSPVALSKKYQSIPLGHVPMTVVAHPQLSLSKASFPQNLQGLPYVAFSNEGMIQQDINYFFERNGIDVDLIGKVDDVTLMRIITETTKCFSILPSKAVRESIRNKKLKQVAQVNSLELGVWAVVPKVSSQRLVIRRLINQYFKNKAS